MSYFRKTFSMSHLQKRYFDLELYTLLSLFIPFCNSTAVSKQATIFDSEINSFFQDSYKLGTWDVTWPFTPEINLFNARNAPKHSEVVSKWRRIVTTYTKVRFFKFKIYIVLFHEFTWRNQAKELKVCFKKVCSCNRFHVRTRSA